MTQQTRWKIIAESYLARFEMFSAKTSKRINPRTGNPFEFFLMEGLDWVTILTLTPDNQIVLVEQYRHGSDTITLESPGGAIDPGEDPCDAASRELGEETGYTAQRFEKLGVLHPNPAMQSMRLHCFLAEGAVRVSDQNLDQGEDIKIVVVPLLEFSERISRGEITHALVVAVFGLFLLKYAERLR